MNGGATEGSPRSLFSVNCHCRDLTRQIHPIRQDSILWKARDVESVCKSTNHGRARNETRRGRLFVCEGRLTPQRGSTSHETPSLTLGVLLCVPSMNDSLEMQVLYPA
jgi:hypothetical protein